MSYKITFRVAAGLRDVPEYGTIACAAACKVDRNGNVNYICQGQIRDWSRPASNLGVGIFAAMLALQKVLEMLDTREMFVPTDVVIYSDNSLIVQCMGMDKNNWRLNGWKYPNGRDVAEKDILQLAAKLEDRVKQFGTITYVVIPSFQNMDAAYALKKALDNAEWAILRARLRSPYSGDKV
ncbi:hypothetical protein F5Y11DRAFT_317035 [Daldinia sp. FL1419]|nr:hypothetical protein F5Y11DRAFT_317035 [Daldinia sp. FL1419]